MALEKQYQILSPDGFSIEREAVYNGIKEAKNAFNNWLKNYEKQGYYSSAKGRIALEDVEDYCTLIEL